MFRETIPSATSNDAPVDFKVDDGWTCSLHSHAMLAADGIGTASTPFEAVQTAAWRALNPQRMPTPRNTSDLEIDVLWTVAGVTSRGRRGRRTPTSSRPRLRPADDLQPISRTRLPSL